MKFKLEEIKFKKLIIGSVILFYIFFIILISIIFNKVYFENLYKTYKNDIMHHIVIAKKIIEEEQLILQREARIIANERVTIKAFTSGVYSTIEKENGKFIERNFPIEKLNFIKIANYLKNLLYGTKNIEQGVALYDENGDLKGYSDSFSKEILLSGDEKYIKETKKMEEYLGNIAVDISTIDKKGNVFYLKAYAPIGKNTSFGYEKSKGTVVIGAVINQEFINKLKEKLKHEIVFLNENEIYLSSIYVNGEILKNYKINFDVFNKNESFYSEVMINNKKYGMGFIKIKNYFGDYVGYIGVGDKIEDLKKLYVDSFRDVLIYGLIIILAILFMLYFMLKKIFYPFDEVFGIIEKIKEGNYEQINLKAYGELGILIKKINMLSEEIMKRELKLKELNQNLEKIVEDRTYDLKETIEKLEKAKEELLIKEKMASIGKLAGGIAHEINNPLSAILAGIQMMKIDIKSGCKIEESLDNIEIIEAAAKRTKEVVAKLHKYIERENTEINKFEVEELIFRAASMHERDIKQNGIALNIDIGDDIEIKGNIIELTQVIGSILANAKDAIIQKGEKNGKINIRSYIEYNKVFITVEDNGIGIKDEDKLKIFDPFFTTKEFGKGLGLSLSLAYEVIKKNKGNISFKSKYGEGTIFYIEFDKE